MAEHVKVRVLGVWIIVLTASWITNSASAQTVTVDAVPSHVANTFSPVRSLGAAIDRCEPEPPTTS